MNTQSLPFSKSRFDLVHIITNLFHVLAGLLQNTHNLLMLRFQSGYTLNVFH